MNDEKLAATRAFLAEQRRELDYVLFSLFQWGRIVSGFALLEQKDPLFAWRERMLDLHGGLARAEAARAAEARSG
jgi:hypothetical protein